VIICCVERRERREEVMRNVLEDLVCENESCIDQSLNSLPPLPDNLGLGLGLGSSFFQPPPPSLSLNQGLSVEEEEEKGNLNDFQPMIPTLTRQDAFTTKEEVRGRCTICGRDVTSHIYY